MITLTREEAQQVLDALLSQYEHPPVNVPVIETLRARLSAPEPEPVAWQSRMRPDWEENGWTEWKDCPKEQADNFWKTPRLHDWVYEARALYTAPPQREWKGLEADGESQEIWLKVMEETKDKRHLPVLEFAVAIEAKLKEKNGG